MCEDPARLIAASLPEEIPDAPKPITERFVLRTALPNGLTVSTCKPGEGLPVAIHEYLKRQGVDLSTLPYESKVFWTITRHPFESLPTLHAENQQRAIACHHDLTLMAGALPRMEEL